ncbi:MAG: AAA family ATPase, partial [Anaerolineales bacterium]|nr:AAA family ATPase [Anaerolineales bacterium]
MDTIAGYTVLEQINQGERTAIYRVQNPQNKQTFVLKLPASNYPSVRDNARLRHEYIIAKNLTAVEGVVHVYALQHAGNGLALVQEDFGAMSLDAFMEGRPLPIAQFLEIALQLVRVLQALHLKNIIHKDLKPQNIIIDPDTLEVRLTDFGIATQLSQESQTVRNVQTFEGSPAYASPEQSGRMNRTLDYRSDFYSLGVTFYEMLTGDVPFKANNFLEVIHAHIARRPLSPTAINPTVPPLLADITLKLMAKTAEERYQSAYGLLSDLATCQQQWQQHGRIEPFPLAQNDLADHFRIPQKLYGRAAEIEQLITAFEQVANGHQLLMIVTGQGGIGKSALVHEVHKPIVQQRGYYIEGKFDQLARNIPFNALIQAFAELVRQLLTESQTEITVWKTKLLDALG